MDHWESHSDCIQEFPPTLVALTSNQKVPHGELHHLQPYDRGLGSLTQSDALHYYRAEAQQLYD